jgi:type 1 glutamine amidotransferase
MKRALILSGGWNGHQPEKFADRLISELVPYGLKAESVPTLDVLNDPVELARWDVIIPNWTMGNLSDDQTRNLALAVAGGTGIAGMHGGTGDAFRGNLSYEWMIGGHFVGHPYVGPYDIRLTAVSSPITAGLPALFPYDSEQYYLLVDPGIRVLAETSYTHEGNTSVMPVAWTKTWGNGRVFYSALGHTPEEFDKFPTSLTLIVRGILWSAGML